LRRMTLLAALAVALLALGAGAVFAQEEQRPQEGTIEEDGVFVEANNQIVHCVGVPCVASGNDDLVYERVGNRKKDRILLKGGDDQAHANTFKRDRDVIKGSSGFDLIYVNDGDRKDKIFGGQGRDKCYVDVASEAVSGCSQIITP
jgi:Ca2+-binding RTX toxin-like protein